MADTIFLTREIARDILREIQDRQADRVCMCPACRNILNNHLRSGDHYMPESWAALDKLTMLIVMKVFGWRDDP